MKPGIYSLDRVDYDAIDAVRFSYLKHMAVSALHYRAALTGADVGTTPAIVRLGGVAHTLTLEPERLWEDYALYEHPEGKKAVFKGKNFDDFLAANPGKSPIKQNELDRATSIAHAILTYGPAKRYLAKMETELALVWRDSVTGLLCKARLDGVSHSVSNCIIELKSSGKVDPWTFGKRYADALYHVQAAWYAWGWKELTGHQAYVKCIAVESSEPHDVVVYDATEVLDTGTETARELLDKVATCRQADKWPGLGGDAELTLRLPKWLDHDDQDLADVGLEWGDQA